MTITPSRGEVWLFDLGMAEKVRPALVVSVGYGDADRALITILPHTTSLRGSQYEITVNVPFPISSIWSSPVFFAGLAMPVYKVQGSDQVRSPCLRTSVLTSRRRASFIANT
jgi:hypothetical protein